MLLRAAHKRVFRIQESRSSCPEAEKFILRSWIRNSPGNETRSFVFTKVLIVFTKLIRHGFCKKFCFLPNSPFWGFRILNSDTQLRCGVLLGLSYRSFVSEFRFLRYETSLVSGFEFPESYPSFVYATQKKLFRFPFPKR